MLGFKKYVSRILFLFVIIHFIFIADYLTAGKFSPGFFTQISIRYVYPLFYQNWNIFAPEPPLYDMKLLFKTHKDSTAFDILEDELHKHDAWPFWYYGKLYTIQDQIAREINRQLLQENILPDFYKNDTLIFRYEKLWENNRKNLKVLWRFKYKDRSFKEVVFQRKKPIKEKQPLYQIQTIRFVQ